MGLRYEWCMEAATDTQTNTITQRGRDEEKSGVTAATTRASNRTNAMRVSEGVSKRDSIVFHRLLVSLPPSLCVCVCVWNWASEWVYFSVYTRLSPPLSFFCFFNNKPHFYFFRPLTMSSAGGLISRGAVLWLPDIQFISHLNVRATGWRVWRDGRRIPSQHAIPYGRYTRTKRYCRAAQGAVWTSKLGMIFICLLST